ncbi:hypothetical protein NXH76_24450 [Blautia schinkii]|nr:hypothetical protein [Blautia schinkii]
MFDFLQKLIAVRMNELQASPVKAETPTSKTERQSASAPRKKSALSC